MVNLEKDLQGLITYDRKNIFRKLKELQVKLDINKKINNMVNFIDDIDYIYLSNLDFEKNDIKTQLKINANKKLELRCAIDGNKRYLKSYGLIKNIEQNRLKDIYKFLILFRLSKKITEVSYFASQFYRTNKLFVTK